MNLKNTLKLTTKFSRTYNLDSKNKINKIIRISIDLSYKYTT